MDFLKLDYSTTNAFSNTVIDYLNEHKNLEKFYNYPVSEAAIPNVIENINKANQIDRTVLHQALEEQYDDYVPNLNVVKNIDLLKKENTYTITTAHQLNLFTGPLYYIFKILNAVKVAKVLSAKYSNYNFVPCYWMGSEDHDFEEINHTYLFGKKLEWPNAQGGSVGEHSTEGITPIIEELKSIIRQGPYLEELIATFKRAYSQNNMSKAVMVLLDELFGKYGLVVIDANSNALKQPFKAIIKDELLNQNAEALVNQQINDLAEVGYKSQANSREINLFYKTAHKRERIEKENDGYVLVDSKKKFTKAAILEEVENAPERFSPNVILRPLHQQLVLPNIAYIGGGSEVAYWMQLKTIFNHYNIHFPMLMLRTSAQIISKNQQKKIDKLDFNTLDIFKDVEVLKKQFVRNLTEQDLQLKEEKKAIDELFKTLSEKAASIDGSLKNFVKAEGQKTTNSLENISKRLIKAEKQSNENSMNQIEKLKELLFPFGGLQERKENFSQFYAKYGSDWLDELLEILNPFEKQFYLIQEA